MSDRATTTASLTFESLYGTHHGWLKSWLTRKLQSAFDADDIAQDTFLRVMSSETLSTIRDPRSFLCTIAKRVMVDLFRRNALEKAYLEMLALMPEGVAPSPEERESQLETLQLVDSMLDGLNGKTREAFLLFATGWPDIQRDCAQTRCFRQLREKIRGESRRALPAVSSGAWVMNPSLTDSRRQALRSASHWYAVLSGERVSPQQEARWQQWYEQDQDNQWAWQQVENLRNQLGGVPGDVASRALHDTRLTRRHVMKGLLLLLGAGGGWQLWQSETGEGLRADYRTAKGAVSRQQLEDGSLLTLNTQSAADVRFDAHQRTVRLWYGEIAITTAKDAQQRPFRVLTRQGQLTALGTEFTVRQQDNLQQHAVEVLLASAPAQKRIVNAGESLQFSASEFGAVKPLDDESTSWTKGILSFSDKPLGEVIATLSRYRNGVLRCDPAVAGLRLSGTFPLKNTDAILNVIAQTLPVKIQSITRYWINISPL